MRQLEGRFEKLLHQSKKESDYNVKLLFVTSLLEITLINHAL